MIWREKRTLLIVLGVLLAANTIFFFTYRLQYQKRLDSLESRRGGGEAALNQARLSRTSAERRRAAYRQIQADVQDVYSRQWATEQERLTAYIAEVSRLAVASGLTPKSVTYARNEKEKKVGIAAETVTINFSVQGDYPQVRRLINLLELSRQFVIIDQITLNSADEKGLITLTLQLKTLFRDTSPAASRES